MKKKNFLDRAKELGPDGKGKGGKKVIDLDYNDDEEVGDEGEQDDSDDNGNSPSKEQGGGALSNSSTNYRNAELAMLCTKSVGLAYFFFVL